LYANDSIVTSSISDPPVPDLSAVQTKALNDFPVRVALVDSGVNYQLDLINRHLARNRDGQLIGYDFWDMDEFPFDAHPNARGGVQRHGTRTASLLLREAPFVSLVPYRYPRPDMSRMTRLLAHANDNDVRVIGLPLGGPRPEQWTAFAEAAARYPHILFVASAGNNGRDIDTQSLYPASLPLDNLLVVTSADDFVRPAQGVNWGRISVDYMVPAERRDAMGFDGSMTKVSGSSYAVSRVVALAARYLRDNPDLDAQGMLKKIQTRFANGVRPAQIARGYIHDPQYDPAQPIVVIEALTVSSSIDSVIAQNTTPGDAPNLNLQLDILVLDSQWTVPLVRQILNEAESILHQCGIVFGDSSLRIIDAAAYLRNLDTGASRTLMDAVRHSGQHKKLAIVFARDTAMSLPFDAEAFGRANTRHRSWLTDSVWLTLALEDRDIALAHEIFHVLVNSGQHSQEADNLMLSRTTGSNRNLSSIYF